MALRFYIINQKFKKSHTFLRNAYTSDKWYIVVVYNSQRSLVLWVKKKKKNKKLTVADWPKKNYFVFRQISHDRIREVIRNAKF